MRIRGLMSVFFNRGNIAASADSFFAAINLSPWSAVL
jgi:hypothetical protein